MMKYESLVDLAVAVARMRTEMGSGVELPSLGSAFPACDTEDIVGMRLAAGHSGFSGPNNLLSLYDGCNSWYTGIYYTDRVSVPVAE